MNSIDFNWEMFTINYLYCHSAIPMSVIFLLSRFHISRSFSKV